MTKELYIDKRVMIPRVDVGMDCVDIDALIRRATASVDTLVIEAENLQTTAGKLAIKGFTESPDEGR